MKNNLLLTFKIKTEMKIEKLMKCIPLKKLSKNIFVKIN